MKTSFYVTLTSTMVMIGALFMTPSIMAQQDTDPAREQMLEEVVVTARMREESLQSVPLSETAFTASQITDANIDQVGDFIGLTPNVTVALSQSAGISFLTIRGIPQVRNGEPPVATVVDGVLQTNSRQFTQDLFDIQSIEVLRGPQGALYGRNAIGGAILINTKQPTNELEGHVRLGYGTGTEYLTEGVVSGPIIEDKLLFRLAARYTDRDGYFTNFNLNRKIDPYEDLTVRGMLKLQASDNFMADFRFSTGHTEAGSNLFRYQPAILTTDRNSLDTSLPFPFDFSIADSNLVDRHFNQTNLGANTRDVDELSLKLDYTAEFGTFTSTTSYNQIEEYIEGDQFPYTAALTQSYFGGAFIADGGQTQYVDIDTWSQEFRITSPADQRIRWMAGVYYLETNRFISTTTSDDLGLGLEHVERDPFFNSSFNPTSSFFADDNNNKAWAVFGNIAYDMTDRLEASFAIRYDEDKREQVVDPRNTGGVPGAVNRHTFSKAQPKVALRYQASDDVSVYTSWGIGFRSGQFNQNGVKEAAASIGINGVGDFVKEETASTFELGFKSELIGNRLRVNGSIYHTTDKNPAYFVFIGPISAQVLVPIDKVDLAGGELEAIAKITDSFDIYAAFGITDSEIKEYAVDPSLVGNHAPYVAKSTLNLGAQYRANITDNLVIFARADYEKRGVQSWSPENLTPRNALNLVNARLGIEDANGRWSLTGSAVNLTDKVYNSEYVGGGFSHPAPPRIWTIDLRYNF